MAKPKTLPPCEMEQQTKATCACGPGKMMCTKGNVVPYLHEYVHEIARIISTKPQALRPPLAAEPKTAGNQTARP
jgi:hypothetical protein